MTTFLTLAVYSVKVSNDFPKQSKHMPIVTIYFIFGLFITLFSLVWFTIASYCKEHNLLPKWIELLLWIKLTISKFFKHKFFAALQKLFKKNKAMTNNNKVESINEVFVLGEKSLGHSEPTDQNNKQQIHEANKLVFFTLLFVSLISYFVIWFMIAFN